MLVQKGLRSLTTTKIAPIHSGEVLMEDFIEGFGITQHKLAVAIGVPSRRINEIVHGKRGITADTVMWRSRYFGENPGNRDEPADVLRGRWCRKCNEIKRIAIRCAATNVNGCVLV